MRTFDYSKLEDRTWDNEILSYVAKIHEFKGKQELYIQQKPVELERLVEAAKIQSTEASNQIEGIVTTKSRLKQLMEDKTMPRNRDEKEILGYRNVLNLVHENHDYISVTPNYILQLHGELLKHTAFSYGGKFKTTPNEIAKTFPDGTKEVIFSSDSEEAPAKFYMVSAPAHTSYETKLITLKDAAKRPLGDANTSNKRVINQFIHPDVLKTCQLSMGMTALEPGSVWNSMPCHTHERRMEIYMYFEVPENQVVMHFMGEPTETRHIVMKNEEAVISPSWSIHCGAGTSNYTFIWAMGGENQEFDDMDTITPTDLK